ncbi:hypothetical protein PP4_34570 [Pseudomonas putida NBRC 14164]|uniref:Uncharacterized protein n=1 Tax=Pseudomonas putida NBRC 14164 TaxID=1211579 RepID=A0ABN5UNC6_PSEPU|nr:hypothetical protein PP4_34570 [Pseudomonas putida NBRC 14164]
MCRDGLRGGPGNLCWVCHLGAAAQPYRDTRPLLQGTMDGMGFSQNCTSSITLSE